MSNAARAATVPLNKGASRSRRYAASAALLASCATFSCGGDQASDDSASQPDHAGATSAAGSNADSGAGQSSGNQGGTTHSSGGSAGDRSGGGDTAQAGEGGDATAQAGASGSLQTAGDGGSTEQAGTSGSAQTAGDGGSGESAGASAGGALATDRACPGFDETGNCRTVEDCADMPMQFGLPFYCAMTPQTSSGCGNPTFLQMCPPEGCGDGMVCMRYTTCGDMMCAAECTEQSCNGENHCVDNQCVAKDCELDGAAPCPDDYTCDPQATGYARHCVPPLCDDGGVECDPWRACDPESAGADADGCVAVACSTDEDCGCGYCVNSRCEPTLGNCYEQQPAMPYGCVWPDEELV